MQRSVFETKKSAIPTKKFSITLPQTLLDDIDVIREKLKQLSPDKQFNVNAICVQALEKAVSKAKKELETLEKPSNPASIE